LAPLNHPDTAYRVESERAMNKRLNGGCQVPIACYATLNGDELHLRGLVGSENGDEIIRTQVSGNVAQAEQLGIEAAENLLEQGAARILSAVYGHKID